MNTIPKYIAYAAIILTADYLGFAVSCKYIAEQVLRTGQMPQVCFLGWLSKAAADAQEKVLIAELGAKADVLAENLILNGKFV